VSHPIIDILVSIDVDEIFSFSRLCNKRIGLKKPNVMTYTIDMEFF